MVFKPVDASGGYDIHFGRLVGTAERAELIARIEAAPRQWLAQEEVELSRAICLRSDGALEPRAVDLRPFVLLDERPWITPGGLTRVARQLAHPGGQLLTGWREQGHMGAESLTYAVWHHTTLRYTDPVGLSFNEVRMRPRDRGSQRTLAFSLLSNPSAVPRSRIDYFGNYVHRVDVTTPARRSRVRRRRRGGEQRAAPAPADGMVRRGAGRRPAPRVRAAQPAGAARPVHRRASGASGTARTAASTRCWRPPSASPRNCGTSPAPPPSSRASTTCSPAAPACARTSATSSSPWCAAPGGRRATSAATSVPPATRCSSRVSRTPGPRSAARTAAGWAWTRPTGASPARSTSAWPRAATTVTSHRTAGSSTAPPKGHGRRCSCASPRSPSNRSKSVGRGAAVHWQQQQQQQR